MTMKELTTKLSASLNMLKGFACEGILCRGWWQVNDNVIEFKTEDDRYIRIRIDDVAEIGTCKIFDERNGFRKPYANVVLNNKARL